MFNNFAINITELEKHLGEEISLNTYGINTIMSKIIDMDTIPLNNILLKFSDDIWDFRGYVSDSVNSGTNVFRFTDIPDSFKEEIKSYVLVSLLDNNIKVQSVHAYLFRIKKFVKYCYNKGIFHLDEITAEDIADFKNDSNLSLRYEHTIMTAISEVLRIYSLNFKDILSNEIAQELKIVYDNALINHIEENKTPHIPKDYFNKMVQLFIDTVNDDNKTKENRITACVLLLISQTGLRISEILKLKTNSIDYKTLHNGIRTPFIKYISEKSIHGNNQFRIVDIFVNKLSEFAFEKLIEFAFEFREKQGTDFLVVFPKTKELPVPRSSFNKRNVELFTLYDNELKTINRVDVPQNLSTVNFRKHKTIKTVTYPTTIQYRVTVCTNLYEKGVPLQYVRKFMGHLSEDMEGYYVRNQNKVQEDVEFSKRTIEGIVSGDLKILGTNAEHLTRDIRSFIEKNDFNVEKDLEVIVEKLVESVPIRAKLGGVCIKSSPFRECTKDYQTNELFCAYNVCPNVFHFFYMCELSYRQCKELQETININLHNEHLRQVEKECLILGRIVREKLVPELEELNAQLDKHGVDNVLINYPDLEYIVNNYDEILLEANRWQNLMKILNL